MARKDIGRDVRDSDCELEYSEAKLVQAAAGLEQYSALDRPDIAYSVKAALRQTKPHEAHAWVPLPGEPNVTATDKPFSHREL